MTVHATTLKRNRLAALLVKAGASPAAALVAANRIVGVVGAGHEPLLIALVARRIEDGASLDPVEIADDVQRELQRRSRRRE